MAGRGVKKPPKKKGANGYKLPDPIPRGEIITDLSKKPWIIGESIGVGGFGEIYSAAPYTSGPPKEYPAVVKIEPHVNGPLFVEMHFYMRNAKPSDIEAWKKKKKLSHLGMPKFLGSGSHDCHDTKYRFLVMERYGVDLWKLFLENGRRFPEHTVYKIALQITEVLEYIHGRAYVHADIKGGNLLLDLRSPNNVFLVDFGLASRCTSKTEYKLDPKKAHNGTIEYTSRDAHMGVPTMRSDFEILGYNMIQWLCGTLPWEGNLKDPSAVQKAKEKAFENQGNFLKQCFPSGAPLAITEYLKLVGAMKYDETPSYPKIRKILTKGLEDLGSKVDGKLEFGAASSVKSSKATPKKTKKPTESTVPRKSPRIKAPTPSRTAGPSLDESTIGVLVDKKRERIQGLRNILDSIEDDSDAEYDICITKKRKKPNSVEEKSPSKTAIPRKPRRRVAETLDSSNASEPEVPSRGTKSRPRAAQKASTRVASKRGITPKRDTGHSDSDMFEED